MAIDYIDTLTRKCGGAARLAALLGVSHQTLYNWVKRNSVPEKMEKIMMQLVDVRYDELIEAVRTRKTATLNEFDSLVLTVTGYDAKVDAALARLDAEMFRIADMTKTFDEFTKDIVHLKGNDGIILQSHNTLLQQHESIKNLEIDLQTLVGKMRSQGKVITHLCNTVSELLEVCYGQETKQQFLDDISIE